MADVQLEHGYMRIANRLAEALLYAPMSGTQFKIMHALIRLTYGWRRRTVTLSNANLARYCDSTPSGAFRAALRDLIAHGAVLQLEQGGGKAKSTLAIQKDFTKWGLYQVGPDRLSIIFGERPENHDDLMHQADLFTQDRAENEAGGAPENGRGGRPEVGTDTVAKSNSGETVAPRKDSERQEKDTSSSSPAAVTFVARLLDSIPDRQRPAWAAEIAAAEQGMHGPTLTGEQVELACRDYVGNGNLERVNLRHFRGYLANVGASSSPRRANSANTGTDDDAVWDQALDVMKKLARHEMAAAEYATIAPNIRAGLKAIGGWMALRDAKQSDLPFRKRDFLRAAQAHREHVPA